MMIIIAIVFALVFATLTPGTFNNVLFDMSMVVVIFVVVKFLIGSQKGDLKGFWLKPSYFFVLGFLAVNFQVLLDYRLGLKSDTSQLVLYPSIFNHCTTLGVVGLAAFVAGYFSSRSKVRQTTANAVNDGSLLFLSLAQLVVFAFFIYNIDLVSFLSGMDYGIADSNTTRMYYFENLLYVCNAVIIVTVIKSMNISNLRGYIHAFPVLPLIIIGLYMIMRLLSGDRGPFIYTALLLMFGYLFATKKKIRFVKVFLILLAGMLFVSVIGIARSLDRSDSFSNRFTQGLNAFSESGRFGSDEKTVFKLTEEFGVSFIVNQVDVNAVEVEGEKLHYGTYQLITVLNSIPFAPGFIANVLHIRPEDRGSSGFANYHFFGGYDRNYGIGTTVIGDFYLDLGVIGVLIGLFLAGMLFRFLDSTICCRQKETIGIYLLLFVLLFSAKSIYVPRSILLIDLQSFVLGVILLFVNSLLTGRGRQ